MRAEGATAPPKIFLEGYCPLKNNQSCDAVSMLKFCSLKWRNVSVVHVMELFGRKMPLFSKAWACGYINACME